MALRLPAIELLLPLAYCGHSTRPCHSEPALWLLPGTLPERAAGFSSASRSSLPCGTPAMGRDKGIKGEAKGGGNKAADAQPNSSDCPLCQQPVVSADETYIAGEMCWRRQRY